VAADALVVLLVAVVVVAVVLRAARARRDAKIQDTIRKRYGRD
jgi:hypothetical protein